MITIKSIAKEFQLSQEQVQEELKSFLDATESLEGEALDTYLQHPLSQRFIQYMHERDTENSAQKPAKRTKNSDAYLRLDLQPGGVDLKGYITMRAAKESEQRGKAVSATRYVQELIEADMNAYTGRKDKRQEVAELLKNLNEKDLETVESVIRAFCR